MLSKKKLAAALFISSMSGFAFAESVAITNANLYTGTTPAVLEGATIVFEDGKISAINPATLSADTIIDGTGKIVTPGLIGSINALGLVEVGAVADTRDSGTEKGSITFNPALAFNPESTLLPLARKGGVTSDIIVSSADSNDFAGLASLVSTSSSLDFTATEVAVITYLYGEEKGSRASKIQELDDALSKQQEKLAKKDDKESDKAKSHSESEKKLTALLEGKLPLIVATERPADILQMIALKAKYNLNLIIAGASGAVAITDKLVAAEVPVIISPTQDLPESFDELYATLANASVLASKGVKIALTVAGDSAHNLHQLRFEAGNAVAHGLDYQTAIRAMTSNLAEFFSLDGKGSLEVGKDADLVVWSGDPLEFSSRVESMWIAGEQQSTVTRQDKLRDRYLNTQKSDLPPGYRK